MLFPINSNEHWFMIFIDNRPAQKRFVYLDSGSGVTASKRTEVWSKVSKIITYYREYLNILMSGEDLAMSNLTISRDTHRNDAQVTSNQQETAVTVVPLL